MATNAAILDDRDPLIQYAGTWSGAGSYSEFYGTTTFSLEPGSTASLSFVGTSVNVYGSVGVEGAASMAFEVDGSMTGTYVAPINLTAAIHHELFWGSPPLSNGTHTLVITQGATPASANGVIFLDYIMYDTTSTSLTYFIDDRDGRIAYTAGWVQDESDEDFQHTSQRTSAIGESFTLEFEGQSIAYYGGTTSTSRMMNASVVIDGGPPLFFGVPPGATTTNNLLFHSGNLSTGTHKLVVTAENDQDVWTDYFLVNPTTDTPTTDTPTLNSSLSTSSGFASSTGPPTSSASSSYTTLPSSPKPAPIAAIVGAVMGIVAILAFLATAFFLFKRRQRKMQPPMPEFRPTPFATFPASSTEPMWQNGISKHHFQGFSGMTVAFPDPRCLTQSSGPPLAPIMILSRKLIVQDPRQYTASSSRHSGPLTSPGLSCQSEEPPRYSE